MWTNKSRWANAQYLAWAFDPSQAIVAVSVRTDRHNLVRCVMAQAVARYSADLERVSLKGTVDALRRFSQAIAQARSQKLRQLPWEDLLLDLARDLVPRRLNRSEPRPVQRHPKSYPLLNRPSRRFVGISHRSRYWNGRSRNFRALNQGPFRTDP